MSVHSLSNLAVQELTDESAAIHSGGVFFQGFNGLNGTGTASPGLNFSDTVSGNILSLPFTGARSFANNKLESFRVAALPSGKSYKISFFDNTDFTGLLSTLTFNSSSIQNLEVGSRNKTGSVRIQTV